MTHATTWGAASVLSTSVTCPNDPRTESKRVSTLALDLSHAPLPAPLRPAAALGILDITKWFGETSGGVKTYLLEKAKYVARHPELRHVLVIPGPRDTLSDGSGSRTYRLRGPLIPTQRAYRFLLATRTTRRILEHERPDLIEVGSPFVVPWLTARAARRRRVPLVCFYHTSIAGLASPFEGVARWYLRRLDALFRVTIVASDFAATELREAGVRRVARVPLGVDLDRFHPRLRCEARLTRRRLGLPDDVPVALYVGRLAREKRLDTLIDAWPAVDRTLGAQLIIVGDGPERGALMRRARSRRIIWIPYVDDRDRLARLHAAADLYVSPGQRETFGLSALEALASGTPVLSADRGGVAELVQRSGAGALFTPGMPDELAERAIELLRDDQSRLGLLARRHAEAEHDWNTVFDRLFDVYREALS